MPNHKINSFFKICLNTIKRNIFFFSLFSLFVLVGGVALLMLNQGDLIQYFSSNRTAYGDFFFKYGTKLGEEWAYAALIGLFLFIRFRYALLILITGLLVMIISFLSKVFFQHPRPSLYYKNLGSLSDLNVVEGVHIVTGYSSFPSGHTMAGFALFTLVALLLKRKKGMAILLFCFALIVGLSRVYLIQHFLKDIYFGGIMGMTIALVIYCLQQKIPFDQKRWIDQKIG